MMMGAHRSISRRAGRLLDAARGWTRGSWEQGADSVAGGRTGMAALGWYRSQHCSIKLTLATLSTSVLDMAKQTLPSFPRYQRLAGSLGERLRVARLRRRMSATEMAERLGVSRMTLYSLEKGDLSVGLGILVRALGVLGLEEDLDRLAADDELGRKLADHAARPSRRVKRTSAP